MKAIFIAAAVMLAGVAGPTTANADVPGIDTYDSLVAKYAHMTKKKRGVDYQAWKNNAADTKALKEVLAQWAQVDPKKLSKEARKAFYINLYNATMLDIVLDNYPLDSVTKLTDQEFGVFSEPLVTLNGKKVSLNELEKTILLGEFKDERIHFAINCASESCPPLAPFAYQGPKLEEQLVQVTKSFTNSAQAFKLSYGDRKIAFSKIFEWYARDFQPHTPHGYISKHLEEPLPGDYEETWFEYDWSLNDIPR